MTTAPATTRTYDKPTEARVPAADRAWRVLVGLYGVALVVMVFLAGSGVFRATRDVSSSATLDAHRSFGLVLDILAVLIVASALVARRSRPAIILSVVLMGLNFLQAIWVKLADNHRALGGLHTVGAIAIAAVLSVLMRLAFATDRRGD